jgi:hypothetical protein
MQGDPESVIFLFNKVFREVMNEDELMYDSMKLEAGSISNMHTDDLTNSSSAIFEENK